MPPDEGVELLDGRLRASVSQGLAPLGRGLRSLGISPNVLTASGLFISTITAWLIAIGELRWGVLGIALSGLVDLLDGSVARTGGTASPRGSFFDSVADRVSDGLVLGGVAWYLAGESAHAPMLAFAAMALSMLISYERAKAEALGFNAQGGLMERAERMILLGFALFFNMLVPALWIMIVLTAVTAVQRFIKVWVQASGAKAELRESVRHRRLARRVGTRSASRSSESSRLAGSTGEDGPGISTWWGSRRPAAGSMTRRRSVARRSRP